ncbi:MAG: polysaccharide deacetylase family protein [Clostridia bacterium]|nr:polysaccharide deacetylase family protein [Clostridia bacterium]
MSKKKLNILTNISLCLIVVFVFIVSFIPSTTVPIYSFGKVNAIYSGNKNNKKVSLMFNVYENSEIVVKIVDILNNKNAKATFFVGGCWADDNEKVLNYIKENGNEIGNHGYFHKDHKKLDYQGNYNEIVNTSIMIEKLCGIVPNLFAPPSGSYSDTTLQVACDLGYSVIMWSKDTIDWRDKDEELVFKRATNNISNGDLILMHPKEHTLLALPGILDYYISNGFEIVSVSENIS